MNSHLGVLAWVKSEKPGGGLNQYELVKQKLVQSDGSYRLSGLDNRPVYIMVIDFGSDEKELPTPHCSYPGTSSNDQAQMVYFRKDNPVERIDIAQNNKGEFVLKGDLSSGT